MNPNTSPGAAGSMGQGQAGQMSQADMRHMQETMLLGMVALETSRIAQEKARNDDLKRFARFEVEEQQTLSEVMRSLTNPSMASMTTGATTGATTTGATGGASGSSSTSGTASSMAQGGMMQMEAQDREMVQKLQQASGAEFDRMYLQGQIEGHRELLQVQDRYIQSNPRDMAHLAVARLARGRIQEHIAHLENIQRTVR